MREYREISVDCKPMVASNGPLPPKMQCRMKSRTKEFDMFGLSEMIHENSNDYDSIPFSLSRKVVEKAKQEIKKIGLYFEENAVAKLHLRELELGPLLGSGGFSDVFEITQIKPCRQVDSMLRSDESKLRNRLVTSFSDNVSFMWCPYAVKILRRKLVNDPKKFASGAVDLLLEGAYLSALEHPNILKLHGISADGPEGFYDGRHDSYFLIVDRLTETLEDRIVRWRKMDKKLNSPWCRGMDRKGRKINLFMMERLKVAADIASAVTYIHSKRIIYRDLKPANIGFDIENKVKVFDFGLCDKLPEGKDGGFHVVHALPGGIGTYGYMSPEMAENQSYNQATDVFSFGMVLFEILSLNRPVLLEGQKVVNTADICLCDQWTEPIRKALLQSWSSVISERPTMDAFLNVIRDTISKLESDVHPCAKTRKLFHNN